MLKDLLVHILVLSGPVSLHHSHFNAGFHAHATYNVLRHGSWVQYCWKYCVMELVVNLNQSYKFSYQKQRDRNIYTIMRVSALGMVNFGVTED